MLYVFPKQYINLAISHMFCRSRYVQIKKNRLCLTCFIKKPVCNIILDQKMAI